MSRTRTALLLTFPPIYFEADYFGISSIETWYITPYIFAVWDVRLEIEQYDIALPYGDISLCTTSRYVPTVPTMDLSLWIGFSFRLQIYSKYVNTIDP